MKTAELQSVIERAQNGDSVAMELLYDEYYDRIAKYALRRVLDQHIAEDITANVFVSLLENLTRFSWRHQHSFNGWIFRIASNEVNQYFRKQSRYVRVGEHNHSADALEKDLDLHQDFLVLHKKIRTLKPKHQDIIHLFYFERLSHKEIAAALGMREGSVRVTLSRSTTKLKKLLNNTAALSMLS